MWLACWARAHPGGSALQVLASGIRPGHPGRFSRASSLPSPGPSRPAWLGQACPSPMGSHQTELALYLHSPAGLESLAGLEIPRGRSKRQFAVPPPLPCLATLAERVASSHGALPSTLPKMASRRGSGHEVGGHNSRCMGTGRRELVTPPQERAQPLTAHLQPSTVVRTASWVPVVTHLVTLLTRVPLGSSLSSGTLSPWTTMQLNSIFLSSSPRAGPVLGVPMSTSPCPSLPHRWSCRTWEPFGSWWAL